ADVEEVGVFAAENFRQKDRSKALEDLHALLIQLQHVVDGAAIELQIVAARIFDAMTGLVGETEGIDGTEEQRAAAETDVGVDDFLPLWKCLQRGRQQGLDMI